MIEIKKRGNIWEAFFNGSLMCYGEELKSVLDELTEYVDEIEAETKQQ